MNSKVNKCTVVIKLRIKGNNAKKQSLSQSQTVSKLSPAFSFVGTSILFVLKLKRLLFRVKLLCDEPV